MYLYKISRCTKKKFKSDYTSGKIEFRKTSQLFITITTLSFTCLLVFILFYFCLLLFFILKSFYMKNFCKYKNNVYPEKKNIHTIINKHYIKYYKQFYI